MDFVELKLAIEGATGLSQDALHIYMAILIQLGAAAVLRRGLAHPIPWLLVLLAELVNEWLDVRADGLFDRREAWASFHDLWNTMLLPTVLMIAARAAPWLLQPRSGRR